MKTIECLFRKLLVFILLLAVAGSLIYTTDLDQGRTTASDSVPIFQLCSIIDATHSSPTDTSAKIDRPAAEIIVDQIVRIGKDNSYRTLVRILVFLVFGLLLAASFAAMFIYRWLLPQNSIHSREITLLFIHHKDGRKL